MLSEVNLDADHWLWGGEKVDVYDTAIRVLKWMRIDERIPARAIHDEHRVITAKMGWTDPEQFVESELRFLFRGYSKCNAQRQSRHVEVWIEKNTLLHIIEPVADEFCRRVVVCRGYASVSFLKEFYERAMEAIGYGQTPTILYLGDWDPSGEDMPRAMLKTLEDELGLSGLEIVRIGLNQDHLARIPARPVPIKPSDTRAKAFIKKYGKTAYEVDALHPEDLKTLVRDALTHFSDMDAIARIRLEEEAERERLGRLRNDVVTLARAKVAELGVVEK